MLDPSLVAACRNHFASREEALARIKALLVKLCKVEATKAAQRAKNLQSAAESVYASLLTQKVAEADETCLSDAEARCMEETKQLALKGDLAWIQASAYVLVAEVAASRSEIETASAYIAHAFRIAPQWARSEFPDIFGSAFKPKLHDLFQNLEAQEEQISSSNYAAQIVVKRAGAVALVPLAGAVSIGFATLILGVSGKQAGYAAKGFTTSALRQCKEIWRSATPENCRKVRLIQMKKEFEREVNDACRRLALELL